MGLDITSRAPLIIPEGDALYNFTGQINNAEVLEFVFPLGAHAATLQNLSECWLNVKVLLASGKGKKETSEFCFELAPAQVKNISFDDDIIIVVSVSIAKVPTDFGKIECDDFRANVGCAPVAFLDFTFLSDDDEQSPYVLLHPANYCNQETGPAPISGLTTFEPVLPTDPIETDFAKTVYDDFIIFSVYQDGDWKNSAILAAACRKLTYTEVVTAATTSILIPTPIISGDILLDTIRFYVNGALQTQGASEFGVSFTTNPDGSVTATTTETWGDDDDDRITVVYDVCA